ncbi:hypothetical protein [Halotia branconii]|uniref:Uncharacterized protein n=1 Tax=Halotia branconii CENA392 TaxID=1539056 RepID=A0AAJ6NSJ0_9CYAN|nr:hypothetical protein [Halotia branconii]WGV25704.1 hypothetical protein QI031_28960 [Halotia branconii CENA392]
MKKVQKNDPIFEQLFAQISPEIKDTFTGDQIKSIKMAFGSNNITSHPVELRVSVPTSELRFYLVFLAGLERRSLQRLRDEKSLHPLWTPSNIIFLIGFLIVLLASSYATFFFILSSVTSTFTPTSPYPTSIPWIDNQSECRHTNRTWRDGKCWDSEHSPMF